MTITETDAILIYWAVAALFFVGGILASRFGLIDPLDSEFSFAGLFFVPAFWPIFVAAAVVGGILVLTFWFATPQKTDPGISHET